MPALCRVCFAVKNSVSFAAVVKRALDDQVEGKNTILVLGAPPSPTLPTERGRELKRKEQANTAQAENRLGVDLSQKTLLQSVCRMGTLSQERKEAVGSNKVAKDYQRKSEMPGEGGEGEERRDLSTRVGEDCSKPAGPSVGGCRRKLGPALVALVEPRQTLCRILVHVCCMSGACLVHIWCMSGACLVYIWCMSAAYLLHFLHARN